MRSFAKMHIGLDHESVSEVNASLSRTMTNGLILFNLYLSTGVHNSKQRRCRCFVHKYTQTRGQQGATHTLTTQRRLRACGPNTHTHEYGFHVWPLPLFCRLDRLVTHIESICLAKQLFSDLRIRLYSLKTIGFSLSTYVLLIVHWLKLHCFSVSQF